MQWARREEEHDHHMRAFRGKLDQAQEKTLTRVTLQPWRLLAHGTSHTLSTRFGVTISLSPTRPLSLSLCVNKLLILPLLYATACCAYRPTFIRCLSTTPPPPPPPPPPSPSLPTQGVGDCVRFACNVCRMRVFVYGQGVCVHMCLSVSRF